MTRRFSLKYLHMLHSCWHYAGSMRPRMLLFYGLLVFANLTYILQPFVLGELVNTLQQHGPDLLHDATRWLVIYVLLIFGFWLFHGPARVIERNVAFHAKTNFLQHYYNLLAHLPMRWHQDHHSGNTMNRVAKAAQGLYLFSDTQFVYAESALRFVCIFIALSLIFWPIAAAEFVFAIITMFVLARFDRVLVPAVHEKNEREHEYAALFYDYLCNIASVISFNLASHTKGGLGKSLKVVLVPLKRAIIFNEAKWFSMMMLSAIAEFIILYCYIRHELGSGSAIQLGGLIAVYQYMRTLSGIYVSFGAHYEQLLQQHTDLAASEPLLEASERQAASDVGVAELKFEQGEIRFREISFAYNKGRQVFDKLNLVIAPHQKVGLVGHSGAGKTTLIQLLLRFYDVTDNEILIDNQNIYKVSHASLRGNIAVIPQDTSLFETSLMENIRFGRLDATDEEVMEAAKKAHAHEFIAQLDEGYKALVGERGVKLSGGQRQRIAIARAILKDAPILILDEATSALDSESERFIQASLIELMKGKTVIAIAHRLSTISHLDRLIVLDKGSIVEDGSHVELLKRGGYYAGMWRLQSGGFLPD